VLISHFPRDLLPKQRRAPVSKRKLIGRMELDDEVTTDAAMIMGLAIDEVMTVLAK
jgi:hypothetical protein